MPKFKIGETVAYAPSSRVRQMYPPGAYKVISVMPREDNQDEAAYRIRNVVENVERVAQENELTTFDDSVAG
jgi:hypothetical protein